MELTISVEGVELPATLTVPHDRCRAGVVAVHGASAGERSYFLYEHLADALATEKVAVLRYDRRPSLHGRDVPLVTQAADALVAVHRLRGLVGDEPVGLWGFSQGAWAAPLAAATDPVAVAFLICVSGCGVSPAAQMRIGCAKQLRKHGYSDEDVEQLTTVRLAVEEFYRTGRGREPAQLLLDVAARQAWFRLACLPSWLPAGAGTWEDMDYDPQPAMDRVSCPVLAFYGETDEWVPVEESVGAWRHAEQHGALPDLTLVRLPGADHLPTREGRPAREAISVEYSEALTRWVRSLLARSTD